MIGRLKGLSVAALLALVAGGCAGVRDGTVFQEQFWIKRSAGSNDQAELGLAEMAKGNYVTAERYFLRALKADPKDYHAAFGLGLIYQNTGQSAKAKKMYEQVIARNPDKTEQFVILNSLATQPIVDVAGVNLALLDSGGVPAGNQAVGDGGPRPVMAAGANTPIGGPRVSGAPTGSAMFGRAPGSGNVGGSAPGGPEEIIGRFKNEDANVVSRFVTLKVLRDQGLITQEEYDVRRRVNIGALLPLTSPPPASGLERPVPATDQISGRLRAIGRALELRAISVGQHAAERNMILDALMPAAPVMVANPALPPQGLLQAADAVRRLEKLQEAGVISSDEYSKERSSIEGAMQPRPLKGGAAAMMEQGGGSAETSKSGPRPAVHLASYKSAKEARVGWKTLQSAHGKLLSGLSSEITAVNLGPRKGTFFRLKAGPFPSTKEASVLCRKLKARRQYCEPTFMKAG